MTKLAPAPSSFSNLQSFLDEIGAKAAEALSEPSSQGGATAHVSKDAPDRLEKAQEGAQSAFNTEQVKKQEGPASVDSQSEPSPSTGSGTQDSYQLNIGTEQKATGEDPSVETASVKGTKDDSQYEGESSHPARTDNSELDGQKYASMDYAQLTNEFTKLGQALLVGLHDEVEHEKVAAGKQPAPGKPAQAAPQKAAAVVSAPSADVAAQAGYELGGLYSGGQDRAAVDNMVLTELTGVIKSAHTDATRVARYLYEVKRAAEEGGGEEHEPSHESEEESASPAEAGGPPSGGGGAPPAGGGGLPGLGGPPGAGGGGGEGGSNVEILEQICNELHITPEELQAVMEHLSQGGAGGAGGADMGGPPPGMDAGAGGPPMGGGAPPIVPPPAPMPGMEHSASVRRPRPTAKAAAEMTATLKEVLARRGRR